MVSTRQDAWTQEEDLLLAEVVLRCIREGGTQLQAFEEVGRKLSRTAAACGFRWNSAIRKQYKNGIEVAKKQRKKAKHAIHHSHSLPDKEKPLQEESKEADLPFNFNEVVTYLRSLYEKATDENGRSSEDVEKLLVQSREQEEAYKSLLAAYHQLEDEYKELIAFLDKALNRTTSKETPLTIRSNGYIQR
ncbi:RsfA family transcriptional regulator [Mangrovibacillus cuniculi]|uniref:RsfA family transcriptional regulator n=1 Tax=Mangrovibacillus cuniculi TaxID=2593652 RepID=A0A7S8CAF6_9BACI|nr:RsfA family transcriptional regulator [Mangrovibacillus cuniculi]QPC46241.1 RsfA family transcriptional regulator [Mangrovibacillus cuniculi]